MQVPERRSASTSFPAVISKDVDGGPPPAMTITTNRRVNDFGAWYNYKCQAFETGSTGVACMDLWGSSHITGG